MAEKQYHISGDGTPGKCRAASSESCPKTRAGDPFHGTLEEANAESEKRFEESYGSTVTLGREDEKKRWDLAARELHSQGVYVYRRAVELGETDLEKSHAEADGLKRKGLAELHGVPESSVAGSGMDYIVEEADGTRRVYGMKGKAASLGYLGVLHPKLDSQVSASSEHKPMIGSRPLSEGEELSAHRIGDVKYYGYGSVELKGHGRVEFPTDERGNPVSMQLWDHIDSSKLPRELFEDESLRESIRNRGIIGG